jgi:hypothetical protein
VAKSKQNEPLSKARFGKADGGEVAPKPTESDGEWDSVHGGMVNKRTGQIRGFEPVPPLDM